MNKIKKVWDDYYSATTRDTILKDNNFFKMEVKSIIANILSNVSDRKKPIKILELGSGTGILALKITSALNVNKIKYSYTGVDFSQIAVDKSNMRKINNCIFIKQDFIKFFSSYENSFDFIITQRSIMALMTGHSQIRLFKLIKKHLSQSGVGIFSEATVQALRQIQKLRKSLGLSPMIKVWHSRYLDTRLLLKIFSNVQIVDFSSTYWLLTRVVYPFFQDPKHNTKFHNFASSLSQEGNYGLAKIFVVRK